MNRPAKELFKNFVIKNDFGLHARPAAKIAKLAQKAKSNVWISRGDIKADASSTMDILALECLKGTEITLKIDNRSDIDILIEISKIFEQELGNSLT